MSIANVNSAVTNAYPYAKYARGAGNAGAAGDASFAAKLSNVARKQDCGIAVEDFKRRHPDKASVVDSYVRAGNKVLERNHAREVDRDSMTMEEYKQFFTKLMDSIPYDISQKGDVNVWSVTEKGWEQMKNDPDYEAWVLGYTATDRSVHNPWASMPGYSPSFHTEHFGASIDEHLGQSVPMRSSESKGSGGDEESWWLKRHKRLEELLEEAGGLCAVNPCREDGG